MPFPVSPNPGDSYTDAYGTVWIYAGSVNGWYRQQVSTPNDTSYTSAISGPAGSNTQVQFNDNGTLAGDSGLTFNKTTNALSGGAFIPTGSTAPTNGLYLSAANSVALSTNGQGRLFIDASGNVGIGQSSITAVFGRTVSNTGAAAATYRVAGASTSAYIFTSDGLGYGGIIQETNHPFVFGANSTERARIRADGTFEIKGGGTAGSTPAFSVSPSATSNSLVIDSSGRVGIGTSDPGSLGGILAVQKNQTADTAIVVDNSGTSGASTSSSFIVADGGVTRGWFRRYRDGTGNTAIGFTDAFLFEGNISGTKATRMVIDSSGRVGIGTTSPGYRLDVSGDIRATNYVYANAAFLGSLLLNVGATDLTLDTSSNSIAFRTGGSERARIDSSGRLLVGTASNSGGALLQVNGDRIRVATAKTPASATDTGTAGEICWDANYIYVCTATNTWKRTAIATW